MTKITLLIIIALCVSCSYKKPFVIVGKEYVNKEVQYSYTYIDAGGNKHSFNESISAYKIGDTIH